MRHQRFTRNGYNEEQPFLSLITRGPAFQFDMADIKRIRSEISTLIDKLSEFYLSSLKVQEEALNDVDTDAPVLALGRENEDAIIGNSAQPNNVVALRGEDDDSTSSLPSETLLHNSEDVSSVEIHRNDGYTSDTEMDERLINEMRQDNVVERSPLSLFSTTSSIIDDFVTEVDDNFGRSSFSNGSILSTAGSLCHHHDNSNRDLSEGALLKSATSRGGNPITDTTTETYNDFGAAYSAMKRKQKKHNTVPEKNPLSCGVFFEGIPFGWNENQVKTACSEHGKEPLHVKMAGQRKGTGMLFSFQVAFLLFYPTLTFH
jgi:hypothetical protein